MKDFLLWWVIYPSLAGMALAVALDFLIWRVQEYRIKKAQREHDRIAKNQLENQVMETLLNEEETTVGETVINQHREKAKKETEPKTVRIHMPSLGLDERTDK